MSDSLLLNTINNTISSTLDRLWYGQLMCGWLCFEIATKKCWESVETVGKVNCSIVKMNLSLLIGMNFNCTIWIYSSGRRVNAEYASEFNEDNYRCGQQHNIEAIPDLTHITFLLELIVANPPLFDQTHPSFGDDKFKFKIWNAICSAWYKKGIHLTQTHFYSIDAHKHCSFRSKLLRWF